VAGGSAPMSQQASRMTTNTGPANRAGGDFLYSESRYRPVPIAWNDPFPWGKLVRGISGAVSRRLRLLRHSWSGLHDRQQSKPPQA
jgi:hypothetical protein